jgi:hypothetical protein
MDKVKMINLVIWLHFVLFSKSSVGLQGSIPVSSFWQFHSNLSSVFDELSTLKTYHFPGKHLS